MNKRRGRNKTVAVALMALTCAGCGTMLRGMTQEVLIDSYPTGAEVHVDNQIVHTPVSLALSRRTSHAIYAQNAQGATVYRIVTSEPSFGWHVWDVLACVPVVCNAIDIATGGDSVLSPDSIMLPLPPPDAGPDYRSVQAAK